MKWLWSPFLWVGAALVAGYIVYRIWRRKPVILRGKVGPRVLRIVAILLVLFGLGVDDRPAQATQPGGFPGAPGVSGGPGGGRVPVAAEQPAPLAENLTPQQIEMWLIRQRFAQGEQGENLLQASPWRFFKSVYARLETSPNSPDAPKLRELLDASLKQMPEPFVTLIKADLDARAAGKQPPTVTATKLLEVARVMEANGYIDAWLIAYLWRHTAPLDATNDPKAAELMTLLSRQVRIVHALIKAYAQVKPTDLGPRVWMSKAGPPAGFSAHGLDRAALIQMSKAYAEEAGKVDLGPWVKDGVALFKLPEKGATPLLVREGKKTELKPGDTLRLGRLDVLVVPGGADVVLEHEVFGKVKLPAGQVLLVWDLPRLLDDAGRQAVSKVVRAALDGKEEATRQVEQALPLVQRTLREELQRQPGAPGAAKLRLMLALFDDAVLLAPAIKETPEKKPGERGPGGPGGPGVPGPGAPPGIDNPREER
jgi:hypothetical protein